MKKSTKIILAVTLLGFVSQAFATTPCPNGCGGKYGMRCGAATQCKIDWEYELPLSK